MAIEKQLSASFSGRLLGYTTNENFGGLPPTIDSDDFDSEDSSEIDNDKQEALASCNAQESDNLIVRCKKYIGATWKEDGCCGKVKFIAGGVISLGTMLGVVIDILLLMEGVENDFSFEQYFTYNSFTKQPVGEDILNLIGQVSLDIVELLPLIVPMLFILKLCCTSNCTRTDFKNDDDYGLFVNNDNNDSNKSKGGKMGPAFNSVVQLSERADKEFGNSPQNSPRQLKDNSKEANFAKFNVQQSSAPMNQELDDNYNHTKPLTNQDETTVHIPVYDSWGNQENIKTFRFYKNKKPTLVREKNSHHSNVAAHLYLSKENLSASSSDESSTENETKYQNNNTSIKLVLEESISIIKKEVHWFSDETTANSKGSAAPTVFNENNAPSATNNLTEHKKNDVDDDKLFENPKQPSRKETIKHDKMDKYPKNTSAPFGQKRGGSNNETTEHMFNSFLKSAKESFSLKQKQQKSTTNDKNLKQQQDLAHLKMQLQQTKMEHSELIKQIESEKRNLISVNQKLNSKPNENDKYLCQRRSELQQQIDEQLPIQIEQRTTKIRQFSEKITKLSAQIDQAKQ